MSEIPQKPVGWDFTAESIVAKAGEIMASIVKVNDEIAADKNPTLDSTILKSEFADNEVSKSLQQLVFLQNVSPLEEVRNASVKITEDVNNCMIEQSMRQDVYETFKKVFASIDSGETKIADAEIQRLVEKYRAAFRRNGMHLDEAKRNEVAELKKQISKKTLTFSKQLAAEKGTVEFTKEELDGLSDDVLEQFEKSKDGSKYVVTHKYPDLSAVFKHAKSAETRKRLWADEARRADFNTDLVKETIKLRAKKAALLGYKTHADYVLEERMAKNASTVGTFLEDLKVKSAEKNREEVGKMLALKNKYLESNGLPQEDKLYAWDTGFYDNLLLETEYKVDDLKISEYFPLHPTITNMFSIFETLFSLKFVRTDDKDKVVWHPDVHQYSVWSAETDKSEFLGWLYLDLHPRDDKYGHAANFDIIPRSKDRNGTEQYPVTALVCNFSKPTPSKPSLLKHSEVVTFFHELGHGIHALVGKSRFSRFSGTSVDWDFVEAPSQMLEFWTWNPQQLKDLSGHYKTGEKLDDELIASLVKTKHVNGASFITRQLFFGIFDYKIHTEDPDTVDVDDLWNNMKESMLHVSQDGVKSTGYAAFGHIMGGYDAGYYGYLWSNVFACDMYYSKFKANPMDPKVGLEYRNKVIGRGGSRDNKELLEDFLGREPNNEAFFVELGIVE